ncbi:MAG TPA: Ig-like domain-containing protein, partial [Marisediminicola sp.]|nr:Ig-like domain-containing protein [Marisediminicola sp.]
MAISIGVLLLLCAVLVGLTAIQGPKLSGARVDTGRVVADTGQQLQMFANQPVAEVDAEQVTIAPHTPFQVTTQADVITVRFSQQLDHGIQYTVTVRGVTSLYQQREAELSYSFTTDAAAFHYLDRADPESERGEDAIIRTGVSGEGSDAIYRGARIQDYAVFEGALV